MWKALCSSIIQGLVMNVFKITFNIFSLFTKDLIFYKNPEKYKENKIIYNPSIQKLLHLYVYT